MESHWLVLRSYSWLYTHRISFEWLGDFMGRHRSNVCGLHAKQAPNSLYSLSLSLTQCPHIVSSNSEVLSRSGSSNKTVSAEAQYRRLGICLVCSSDSHNFGSDPWYFYEHCQDHRVKNSLWMLLGVVPETKPNLVHMQTQIQSIWWRLRLFAEAAPKWGNAASPKGLGLAHTIVWWARIQKMWNFGVGAIVQW